MEEQMATHDRSLNDIRRETEATRAQLTGTVNELRSSVTDTVADIKHNFSPAVVKKKVGDYVRSRGETILSDVTEAARRNPMQAVAVGIGAAYPLLRIARAIPLPIALIGAGYFFAGTKRGRDLADGATKMMGDVSDKARDKVDSLREQATDSASSAMDTAKDAIANVKNAMPIGHSSAAGGGMSATASSITDTLRQTASDIPDQAKDLYGNMRESARDVSRHAGDMVQQNPLLVAGIGLFVGGLIASLIPKVKLEEDLMGEASAALGEHARDVLNQGYSQVKEKADQVFSDIADKAEQQGFGADGISDALRGVQDRLQRVADRGIDAALQQDGESKKDNRTTKGSNHNG
jgi:ElaB/YqjD/DUF883 family membrane-anchored ribosome-binding protein